MDKLKTKLEKIKKQTGKRFSDFRKNPKRELITFINWVKEIIKNNILFFVFVLTLLFNTVLLRYFTIHTLENVFYFKPFLADLSVILIIGSFGFLVKEKRQFSYLLVSSILLTLICIINSCYYTFYTSFSSISLLATSKYVVAVGDAVVENVLRPQDLIYIWAPIALIFVHHRLKKMGKLRRRAVRDQRKFFLTLCGAALSGLIVMMTLTSLEIGRFSKKCL